MIPPKPREAVELTTRDLNIVGAPSDGVLPDVVVAVTVHSPALDLSRCLHSIAEQDLDVASLGVVILLDSATAGDFNPLLPTKIRDKTWLLHANCGTPARARNAILEFAERHIQGCRWVARMDWDDKFAAPNSLSAAIEAGDAKGAKFVLGGNRVLDRDGHFLKNNAAGPWLRDKDAVASLLDAMAHGTADNELPSCNLLLRTDAKIRYPDTSSAEDHWLVAELLLLRSEAGAVVESVLYADYTLNGACTSSAKTLQRYQSSRLALSQAAKTWLEVSALPGRILGLGQEGIVREHGGTVFKHFYPDILSPEKVAWLGKVLTSGQDIVPVAGFTPSGDQSSWVATYPWEETQPFETPSDSAVAGFLSGCLEHKLVCGNIKRTNFRIRDDGSLCYIDIGNWLIPMDVSVFRDSAARLYSIGVLGNSDEELLRRPANHAFPVIWERLPGYADYYGQVVSDQIMSKWPKNKSLDHADPVFPRRSNATLLIKACAMDEDSAEQQIRHLVDQLVGPGDFAERILVIDPFEGPFLRQYTQGDLQQLLSSAQLLLDQGILDRILIAPNDRQSVSEVNKAWFDLECHETHSTDGIPVSPQLWAFEQVATRFVLQCDIDALIGRRDRSHDYLKEMIEACEASDVTGVAFNIPLDPSSEFRPYNAPPGEYKPEVRCGLLDLDRLKTMRPLPNRLNDGRLEEPWYRSLHAYQRQHGLRTLRGGDHNTFYIHPLNPLKSDTDALDRVRDLISQGYVPNSYWGQWDVGPEPIEWTYPPRTEPIVILARGRNTSITKIDRFANGLEMQSDQNFGLIVIDDASSDTSPKYLDRRLQCFGDRLTLVRHRRKRGRMFNNVLAIRELCKHPEAFIVVVDLDDTLADPSAMTRLRELIGLRHDVVLAAPFRPEAPTKIYQPDFMTPRKTFGGDVWIHLRAFSKTLFERIPDEALQLDGKWLEQCDDYAIMVPIVEMAQAPIYIPEYWYWHERTTGWAPDERASRDKTISRLLEKPSQKFARDEIC